MKMKLLMKVLHKHAHSKQVIQTSQAWLTYFVCQETKEIMQYALIVLLGILQ